MTSDEIRTSFLEFFKQRGHVIERSDTLVPKNDPTLLFTSAGMVQFKPYYTGEVPVPYRRAATVQKCLRAGGKANDLDEVGKTARHLTFFEMLGNFSFGDYFKREAILWAWEYTTQVLRMPADDIWVSVFVEDDEAAAIWEKEIGLPPHKIPRLGAKDNFWGPAGDRGACGPCSELHIDRGQALGCGAPDCAPGCPRCERFMEFWNLVFPQYDQQPDGTRLPLKNRGIDTGMGLERLAALLQHKETVFDTDALYPIIEAAQAMVSVRYKDRPVPFRVIADHVRALSFMIADGILPSNEGRGYVERRLLRRAARFGRELGMAQPFLYQLTEVVIERMSHHYPELAEGRRQIQKIIHTEEERFSDTLSRGMELLDKLFDNMQAQGQTVVPGDQLFRLYDTYGFPLDLAADMAAERGFTVDQEGFEQAMQQQRALARSAWSGSGESAVAPIYRQLREAHGDTEFRGYTEWETSARILALIKEGRRVDTLSAGEEGEVIVDRTPFYAESGGQIGDTGILDSVSGNARVLDTQRPIPKLIVHRVRVSHGTLHVGDTVELRVDMERRRNIMNHHTATHLLQAALRNILGDHVHQAGSLVAPDRLRFDFTHFEAIGLERLQDIEQLVNDYIRRDEPVTVDFMPLDEARKRGAMALFGEKYENIVRVVGIGDFSLELCGGTHVPRTGVIGLFKITSDSSISAGVRRIEAMCGEPALTYLQQREAQWRAAAELLGTSMDQITERLRVILDEQKRLSREVTRWKLAAAAGGPVSYDDKIIRIGETNLLVTSVNDQDAEGLRLLMDRLRDRIRSGVVVLGSAQNGKVALCVGVTPDLTARISAVDIVKHIAPLVGGGGGGRPDLAQAGGKKPEGLEAALQAATNLAQEKLRSR